MGERGFGGPGVTRSPLAPSGRMSAGQCLQHPWLNNLAEKAKRCNRRLKSQVLLKKYVMRRRWKVRGDGTGRDGTGVNTAPLCRLGELGCPQGGISPNTGAFLTPLSPSQEHILVAEVASGRRGGKLLGLALALHVSAVKPGAGSAWAAASSPARLPNQPWECRWAQPRGLQLDSCLSSSRLQKNFIGVCAANRFKKITSSGSLTALGV